MKLISFRFKGMCIALALVASPTAMVYAQKAATVTTLKASTEVRDAVIEDWVEKLTSTGLSESDARDLARRIVANDPEALATAKLIFSATGTTQSAGVSAAVNAKLVTEIKRRRLTDASRGGAADGLIGKVVIEEVVGKAEANKLPGYASQRAGEVARALLDAKAGLQLVGEDEQSEKGKKLLEDIVRGALTGTAAKTRIHQTIDPIIASARKDQEDAIKKGVGVSPVTAVGAAPGGAAAPVATGSTPNINSDKIKQGAAVSAGKLSSGGVKAGVGGAANGNVAVSSGAAAKTGSAAAGNTGGTGSGAAGGAGSMANDINFGRNSRITGGDGTGADAGSRSGHVGSNSDPAKGSGTSGNGAGAGSGNHPDGGAGRQGGGGSGGGSGSSSGAGNGSGGGSGGGTGSGSGSGSGNGGGGSGSGSGSGNGSDGSGGGDNGGGTGDTESHERTDYELDLSGDGMTVEYVDGTPLAPGMESDHGTGMELYEATGGRVGGVEASRALRGIELKGGSTVTNPVPDRKVPSGVLLTPEEQKNAERAIGTAKGGGVTDPANDETKGAAVTDRDLKDLGLRGTGGAKGPSESGTQPGVTPPQDPRSPIGGKTPVVGPTGGVKVQGVQGVQQVQKIEVDVKSEVAR